MKTVIAFVYSEDSILTSPWKRPRVLIQRMGEENVNSVLLFFFHNIDEIVCYNLTNVLPTSNPCLLTSLKTCKYMDE